jgi:cellulose biosynthesis protein BcsQ
LEGDGMKSLAFGLLKGGVGKTTLTGNVGRLMADAGRRVLMVDADYQASLSSWLLREAPEHELAEVLQGKIGLEAAVVSLGGSLAILPSYGVDGDLKTFSENALVRMPFVFRDLAEAAAAAGYDVLLFDTHPGASQLERCVLLASSEVVTPLTAEYLSVDGLELFAAFLEEIRTGFKAVIEYKRLVLNMVNRSFRRHVIYQEKVGAFGFRVYEVGQDSKIPEAQMMHRFLSEHAPSSKVLPELRKLAAELVA